MVGVDAAREDENRAEAELEQRRQQVADAHAEERAPAVAREARVVGNQRRPGDGHRDDDVDAEPERAMVHAGVRPEVPEPRAVEDPPGEINDRSGNRPDRELPDEAPDEADRPQQREQRRQTAEGELPDPDRLEAEELVAQQPGRRRDHDQLEHRPAQALQHVEHGREVGAALPERRTLEDHRRHPPVGPDERGRGEHRVADQPADERRRQRVLQREVEVRRQNEHEQRDAEVRPEQRRVEQAEHAETIRYRLDSPLWCLLQIRSLRWF